MVNRKVKIYTTPACPFCGMAKEFLNLKGVDYEETNVGDDVEGRREMVELSNQMGVPVIVVGDEVVVGFNQAQLESLLTE